MNLVLRLPGSVPWMSLVLRLRGKKTWVRFLYLFGCEDFGGL